MKQHQTPGIDVRAQTRPPTPPFLYPSVNKNSYNPRTSLGTEGGLWTGVAILPKAGILNTHAFLSGTQPDLSADQDLMEEKEPARRCSRESEGAQLGML